MASHVREVNFDQDPEDDDRVDSMLRKAGCLELNNQVSFCFNEHRDWRKCQDILTKLKNCMKASQGKHLIEKSKDEEEEE